MEAKTLNIYTNEPANLRLLKSISRKNPLTWKIHSCPKWRNYPRSFQGNSQNRNESVPAATGRASPRPGHAGEKHSLIVTLCHREGTEATLLEMSDHLSQYVWLIAGHDYQGNWSPDVYIPIDSMVVSLKEMTPGVFLLVDMWFPARYLEMKQSHLGTWYANAADKGETEEEFLGGNTEFINRTSSHTSKGSTRLTLMTSAKYDRRKDLSGVHFVVTFVRDGHAHFKTFDSAQNKHILSGFYGEVLETLKDRLNFTYTIRTPDDGEYGRLRNGSWTGLISDVLNKRADIIVAFLSQTYERAQVIDYSSVLLKFSYRIFARPSTNGFLSWTSYTQPFTSELWVSIVSVLFLLAAALWSLSHYYQMSVVTTGDERGGNSKTKTLVEDGKIELESNLVQCKRDSIGWPYTPDITGLRIVFWTAYVFGVMVLTSYSAKLVSFLAVTGNGLLFDSLEDLRALGNYRLGILKGSVLEDFFRKPTFRVYWNSLIAPYEDTLPLTYEELRGSALASPKYGYVGSYEVQRLDPIGACTFRSARQHLLFNDGSLAWGKGFPYGPVLNHYINKMRETGILHKLKLKWYPEPYSCPAPMVIALDLKKVFTAFVPLALGMGLSVFILLGEILYSHLTHKTRLTDISGTSMHPEQRWQLQR
ncbi:probable glutamate receptor [Macrobrachium nipponense]|uniref:probable glutamate receptor n=1 Tax=Macrobrachium nipponense TaxID=159736 RepID=UPI0030C8AC7F